MPEATKQIDDGGTAFPLYKGINHRDAEWQCGMTLRDYFAAKALVGLVHAWVTQAVDDYGKSEVAEDAYEFADLMIAHRKAGR